MKPRRASRLSNQFLQQAIVSRTEITESGISADGIIEPMIPLRTLTSIVESTKFMKLNDNGQWGALTQDERDLKSSISVSTGTLHLKNSKPAFKN